MPWFLILFSPALPWAQTNIHYSYIINNKFTLLKTSDKILSSTTLLSEIGIVRVIM